MNWEKWMPKINFYLVLLFIVYSFFFPADPHDYKKLLFAVIILINIPLIFRGGVKALSKEDRWTLIIGVAFPVTTIAYSILLTHDIVSSVTHGLAPFFFLLLLVVNRNQINFEKVILFASYLLIGFYALLITLDLTGIFDIMTQGSAWALETGIGYFGEDPDAAFYYKIYVKTSPLLVIPLFYGLYKKKYWLSALAYGALFLSGSKANIFFPFIGIVFFMFDGFMARTRKQKMIVIGSISAAALFCLFNYQYFVDVFVTKSQTSNTVRIGHLQSFVNLYIEDPWLIFTGMGLGSEFYSLGTNSMVSSFEFSFLDLFRQLGIFFFSFFMCFLIMPFIKLKSVSKYYLAAFISYLAIAATNPLLYSSTAFMMYVYVYYCMSRDLKASDSDWSVRK